MTQLSEDFLRTLCSSDFAGLRRLWSGAFPRLALPRTDDEARTVLHMARTESQAVPLHLRLYSHEWLEDRGLPSKLPDPLRPPEKRSRIVEAIGVSVKSRSGSRDAVARAKAIEAAMAQAGGDAMAAGITNPREISRIMWAAREKFLGG